MVLSCRFKKLDYSESLARYAEERLSRLDKFHPQNFKIHLTISKQGHKKHISLNFQGDRASCQAQASDEDFYTAVDKVYTKVMNQLKRKRARVKNHKNYNPRESLNNGQVEEDFDTFGEEWPESA